jgi:fructose-1,6-bisphosphatase/inositol monophosphatase family enzyme
MEIFMQNLPDESKTILNATMEAAEAAGEILRKEFNRTGGPRGDKKTNKAKADKAAEHEIYDRLSAAFPDYGFLAEWVKMGTSINI